MTGGTEAHCGLVFILHTKADHKTNARVIKLILMTMEAKAKRVSVGVMEMECFKMLTWPCSPAGF